jgi:hypothetical protein
MQAWYVPTFNGDLRLEAAKKKTKLTIVDPTPLEKKMLVEISAVLLDRGWIEEAINPDPEENVPTRVTPWHVMIDAPLEKVGPVIVNIMRPGPAVLTAVKFADGKIEVCEHHEPGQTGKDLEKLAEKDDAKAAATTKRPTPSCPNCFVGAIEPATQVLLEFLTPEQHETWSQSRYIVVRGGLSGHRYIIAHRASEIATRNGRICWDADDRGTLHFHDQSVPPEEEVLAAMLILQHREHWLRNEATCLAFGNGINIPPPPRGFQRVFKNPFGDIMDGIWDSQMTAMAGGFGLALLKPPGFAELLAADLQQLAYVQASAI